MEDFKKMRLEDTFNNSSMFSITTIGEACITEIW
ncbi:hypothetical protein Ccrd_010680, partial [Cynara cardunculus var. scolymus]